MNFEEICQLDPYVLAIFQEARAIRVLFDDGRVGRTFSAERAAKLRPDPNFCRTQLWYAPKRERGEQGLKEQLQQRVGWGAWGPGAKSELKNSEAWDICSSKILDAIPTCQHAPDKIIDCGDGVQVAESQCRYSYPVPPVGPGALEREEQDTAGFTNVIDQLNHAGGVGPEPTPVDVRPIDDKAEPVYIVRTDDEKWGLWYALLHERWTRGELSKWYAHNAIFTCDENARGKLLGLTKLEFIGALRWKPIVLTFKDEELERKLFTANAQVFTIENPQSLDEVHKELAKYVPPPEISTDEEAVPAFPRLPGALGQLVDGITKDLAYDHKALAVLTYMGVGLAGLVKLTSDRWLQTRFYSCMVGPPGTGKSAPDTEVQRALFDRTPSLLGEDESWAVLMDVRRELSIDSGPALVQALCEHGRMILVPDELADQFEKAKTTGTGKNSLFGEFLKLYEGNKTANRTKLTKQGGGLVEVTDALLAIMGSVTTTRFDAMWNGAGGVSSGLQSRFVYSYSEQVPPRIKTPNDEDVINEARAALAGIVTDARENTVLLSLSEAAQGAVYNWRALESDADELKIRILDMAKRFVMIVAACNRQTVIDEATMRLGLAFADYQIALREKLCPPDSAGNVQAFEHSLLKFFGKNPRASKPQAISKIKPETRRGGYAAFNQAFAALSSAGKLGAAGKTRKGEVIWSFVK